MLLLISIYLVCFLFTINPTSPLEVSPLQSNRCHDRSTMCSWTSCRISDNPNIFHIKYFSSFSSFTSFSSANNILVLYVAFNHILGCFYLWSQPDRLQLFLVPSIHLPRRLLPKHVFQGLLETEDLAFSLFLRL